MPESLYEPTRGLGLWDDDEITAALEVLRARSPFRYYGPDLRNAADRFEEEFGQATGARHCVALSSGTAALASGLIGLGIPEGAEVIVPAVTFIGCVNAIVLSRGVPAFAEVDDTLTLDPVALEDRITDRTFAIMPVHLGNVAADLDPIRAVAARHGLRVLEDAAQAMGVRYRGWSAGSHADAGAFSFQLDKNITAGEGGAVITNDDHVADRVRRFADQGGQFSTARGSHRGEHSEPMLGMNFRITELASTLLSVQLSRLDAMVERLRGVARSIRTALPELEWRRIPDEAGTGGDVTFFMDSRMRARRCVHALVERGIPAYTLYQGQPVYANPAVRNGQTAWGHAWDRVRRCRTSEALLGRSITIGLGARMTDAHTDQVIAALRDVCLTEK